MRDETTEADIREKLSKHYGGDNEGRELVRNARRDEYDGIGSVVYSLQGSPPKGYAIVIPAVGGHDVNLYDHTGKRFRRITNTTVPAVEELPETGLDDFLDPDERGDE